MYEHFQNMLLDESLFAGRHEAHTPHNLGFPRANWVNNFLDVSHALSLFWFPYATGGINSAPESYFPTLPSLSGLMEDAAEGFSSLFVRAPESRRSSEDLENEPTGCAHETSQRPGLCGNALSYVLQIADCNSRSGENMATYMWLRFL